MIDRWVAELDPLALRNARSAEQDRHVEFGQARDGMVEFWGALRATDAAVLERRIVGGVDTHGDIPHAAVVLLSGARVADAEFPATTAGYTLLLACLATFVWATVRRRRRRHRCVRRRPARHLTAEGVRVVELNRPDRRQRRMKGKSDPLDAYAAADAVLSERATATQHRNWAPESSKRSARCTPRGPARSRHAPRANYARCW